MVGDDNIGGEDGGVINRFGFNNDGMERIATRLAARPEGTVVGLMQPDEKAGM